MIASRDAAVPSFTHVAAATALVLASIGLTFVLNRPRSDGGADGEARRATRVILISLDTLRQDHLSVYGYPRPTSPNLERFAESAVTFTNAMAQAPYTLPSHMTMFTGLHPRAHGVVYLDDRLPDRMVTMAELLRDSGFRTAAFTDGGFVKATFGFDQGFDVYHDTRAPGGQEANGFRRFGRDVREWISIHRDEPFFLFVHTFDTHGPYYAEDRYRRALAGTEPVVPDAGRAEGAMDYVRSLNAHEYLGLDQYDSVAAIVDVYDATIRFVDEYVGQLLRDLETLGILDETLVIITSDHGEAFLDHELYVGHGLTLYEEEVRVPLLVRFPGGWLRGRRCDAVVRLLDLLPTVATATGTKCPPTVQGKGLADAVLGRDREPRIAFGVSPNLARPRSDDLDGQMCYVRRGDVKYIDAAKMPMARAVGSHLQRAGGGRTDYDVVSDPLDLARRIGYAPRLFDLGRDPGEHVNVAAGRALEVERIRDRLRAFDRDSVGLHRISAEDPTDVLLDPETIDNLVQQGYVGASQAAEMKARWKASRDD